MKSAAAAGSLRPEGEQRHVRPGRNIGGSFEENVPSRFE